MGVEESQVLNEDVVGRERELLCERRLFNNDQAFGNMESGFLEK